MLPIHRPTVTTCFWSLVPVFLWNASIHTPAQMQRCLFKDWYAWERTIKITSSILRHLHCGVTGPVPYSSHLMASECPFNSTPSPRGIPRTETAREWGGWVKLTLCPWETRRSPGDAGSLVVSPIFRQLVMLTLQYQILKTLSGTAQKPMWLLRSLTQVTFLQLIAPVTLEDCFKTPFPHLKTGNGRLRLLSHFTLWLWGWLFYYADKEIISMPHWCCSSDGPLFSAILVNHTGMLRMVWGHGFTGRDNSLLAAQLSRALYLVRTTPESLSKFSDNVVSHLYFKDNHGKILDTRARNQSQKRWEQLTVSHCVPAQPVNGRTRVWIPRWHLCVRDNSH